MKLFSKKSKAQPVAVQTAAAHTSSVHPFASLDRYTPESRYEYDLYSSLREAVPVIDAAIGKIVRLVGSFEVKARDERFQPQLEDFADSVAVSGGSQGIRSFVWEYLDELLTFGTAVGEMVPDAKLMGIGGLYVASLKDVTVVQGDSPMELVVCRRDQGTTPVANQHLVLRTLLNPQPGTAKGTSIMKGLPFVSSILLKIFGAVGQNWERAGNIRYAVSYNPGTDTTGTNARARAKEIAREWSRAMRDDRQVCDFVSVGDVSVKVIGADGQVLDCDVPVRHLMEQIVSKLCIPPFLLGLSWSSTERMSALQTDILTSELEYYRSLLTPIIRRICETQLRFMGSDSAVEVVWNDITLQDEEKLAQTRLRNAQAAQIENSLEVKA